jgi:periplasmic protein TonB
VSIVRNSLFPYLLISTAFHLLLVLSWYGRPARPAPMEEILVKLLPPPAPVQEKSAPRAAAPAPPPPPKAAREVPREKATRAELPPGKPAKIDRAGAELPPKNKNGQPNPAEKNVVDEPTAPRFETAKNDPAAISSATPTLKDLLPPVYQPSGEKPRIDSEPIRLDSRDPHYSEYLNRVKQALNLAWWDPSVARSAVKSYGLDGKLVVRFLPGENGEIEEISLIRTSGYAVLDQEAIRVIAAAAPYFGRPPRAGRRPIDVTFIYEKDNRFTPR